MSVFVSAGLGGLNFNDTTDVIDFADFFAARSDGTLTFRCLKRRLYTACALMQVPPPTHFLLSPFVHRCILKVSFLELKAIESHDYLLCTIQSRLIHVYDPS